MNDTLVACDACGNVFTRQNVPTDRCPVCDHTTRKPRPLPGIGRVHQFWSEVEV